MLKNKITLTTVGVMLLTSTSFATGFERNLVWSGKWAALGGASNAAVEGPEAIAFNPAGIGRGAGGFSLNLSPTINSTDAPVLPVSQVDNSPGLNATGESVFNPAFAVLFGKKVNERLGVGFGVYQQGSVQSEFTSLNFNEVNGLSVNTPVTAQASLTFTEISGGFSYNFGQNWSVGAGVRMGIARGNIDQSFVESTNNALNYQLGGLQDETIGGFRLGLQYHSPDEKWGMGFTYRSSMDFEMEGNSTGTDIDTGATDPFNGGSATLSTTLPDQFNFGTYFKSSEMDTVFLEGNYTKYSVVDRLDITGRYNNNTKNIPDIILNWDDMWNLRVGFEHDTGKTQYRFGYALGSQVSSDTAANAVFAPPAMTHSIAGGMGLAISEKMRIDGALEYTFANGTGRTDNTGAVIGNVNGEYDFSSFGAHASLNYSF